MMASTMATLVMILLIFGILGVQVCACLCLFVPMVCLCVPMVCLVCAYNVRVSWYCVSCVPIVCPVCGYALVPRIVCPVCGYALVPR